MKLVEMFYSLQGEGLYSGTPSIFIRFGGCNLTCKGFECTALSPLDGSSLIGCDTLRAVNAKHFSSTWQDVTGEELCSLLETFKESLSLTHTPDVVITGGEPMLHFSQEEFAIFGAYLVKHRYRVTVETNGTIIGEFEKFPFLSCFTYALAIKLSSCLEPFEKRVVPEAIDAIVSHAPSFFKFVVSKASCEQDKKEIESLTNPYKETPVFCMPMGGNKSLLEENAQSVFELCMKQGWRYSDRLHIRIYNTKERI